MRRPMFFFYLVTRILYIMDEIMFLSTAEKYTALSNITILLFFVFHPVIGLEDLSGQVPHTKSRLHELWWSLGG